jgi:aminopeptidase YwaD
VSQASLSRVACVIVCIAVAVFAQNPLVSRLAFAADRSPKTTLLSDAHLAAIVAEASGALAKDTVVALGEMHRVQASSGFRTAAEHVAAKAREYGLEQVQVESFPADGKTTYGTFRSYYGWEAKSGVLAEIAPRSETIADYSKMRVALADYSNDADVEADLVDAGRGTSDADYAGKDVAGKIVLAGGNVAAAHAMAVEKRGAAGVLSYQQNQTTGWSGDYQDNVRWGHLSPYNLKNTFAFMISLRQARAFRDRLAGEKIRLRAVVKARVKPATFDVVSAVIPGTDAGAGEIVFTCHLCHQKPGANDNASGAATILEDARLLASLIKAGKLPRPRRAIRFIWPPEIAGTACYFARHPEVVKRMRAAIHMDMVGGDFGKTKAVFHVTRTPASLPSCVNDVAAVFGEYVIEGGKRAAAGGDASDAILEVEGTKEPLVADFAPFSMGSDHDVYQEGSFRVPTIYLNDWPDVFIHTNNDTPSNIDPTKLRRVAVIGAASGYFLASAGAREARRLAVEVATRGAARQGDALRRALAMGTYGAVTVERFSEAQQVVEEAARREREALESVKGFAPDDSALADLVDALAKQVSARGAEGVALVNRFVEIPAAVVKEDPAASLVPKRNPAVVGPMSVYYFDYLEDRLGAPVPGDGLVQYETLNLVDGRRSVRDIRVALNAAYGSVSVDDVLAYLRALEKAGVVTLSVGSRQ